MRKDKQVIEIERGGKKKNEGVDFLSDTPGLLSHEGFWLTF
jgi:hypothetical protein